MKTAALVVDEESILYDFGYDADISRLDTKSVKTRPCPSDSALTPSPILNGFSGLLIVKI
jgi:hypothetical protein